MFGDSTTARAAPQAAVAARNISFFIFTYFLGTQSDEFVFPLELCASMFSSQTDSFLRSFSRGPRKADPHARVYNPPKDNAIIHYFASTAQGGVKGEFKKNFEAALRPPPRSIPKAAKNLDFIGYRGVCPQFPGYGNGRQATGKLAQKIFDPAFPAPPPAPFRTPARPRTSFRDEGRGKRIGMGDGKRVLDTSLTRFTGLRRMAV